MKTLLLFSLATLTSFGQVVKVPPRQIVPMDVQLRAKAAVQAQVDKTLKGDFQGVVEKMNPDYLKVLSREAKIPVDALKAKKLPIAGDRPARGHDRSDDHSASGRGF